jgi:class 3 adenylate cyclase/tetratricopeptide (TPR) repeat protein
VADCPSCGAENPEGFKFCGQCAAALIAPAAIPEERKTVTTLFCDLVGSTAMGEDADPEDVDALLRRYGAIARKTVEIYGGVVEKFIGDAVVAVFGVPAAHEDDAERAVRAGLRLVQAVEDLPPVAGHPVRARVGINTGEALVRLDVQPASGEGLLTGDAVNTCARLQSHAPPMGVVVGALTQQLTRKAIVYEALEPVTVKGKRHPQEIWLAKQPVARTAAPVLEGAPRFIGRSVELSYLVALLDKAADSFSPQVVVIVGDPGIGKSRLVAELLAHVDSSPGLVTWRQGRCPPYGEGVTFWALAEIVKAHAGILETDDRTAVEAKLEEVLPEDDDRAWLRQRLRALLGLESTEAGKEENFTAWLRFLEGLAAPNPAVLVLEDLHWADEALLDFLEFVAGHVAHVPLMIVATARPELFERRPSFAAAVRVNRIALEPLSQEETEELVDSVLDELGSDLKRSIARQAQGNPFYAEESARLVKDRAGKDAGVAALADSVQAVIAARLDALAPRLKAVLADASVAGEVFWDGLVASLGGRSRADAAEALDELTARQLVYRVRASRMAGQKEYAFGHALTREVAYGQLPRLARARKHAAVVSWIEGEAGAGGEEPAEVLSHHCLAGLELAEAAGESELAMWLKEPAIRYLTAAGKTALFLDVRAAERHFSRAMELAGPSCDEHPDLLLGYARVLSFSGLALEARGMFERAIEALLGAGRPREAAVAMCQLGFVLETLGEPVDHLPRAALALLADDEPSPELARVLSHDLGASFISDSRSMLEIVDGADRILAMCDELHLPVSARALHFRGAARVQLGERDGIEDLDAALEAAKEQGIAEDLMTIQYNRAAWSMEFGGAAALLAATLEGLEMARRRGDRTFATAFEAALSRARYFSGDWDEALRAARDLDAELEATGDNFDLFVVRIMRIVILMARGEADEAGALVEWLERIGHASQIEAFQAEALLAVALVQLESGDCRRAREQLRHLPDCNINNYVDLLPVVIRTALSAGDVELAEMLAERAPASTPLYENGGCSCSALLAETRGEREAAAAGFADAAARWHDFGVPYEEAHALLGQGRCLVALGRADEASEPLEGAREIFVRLGAKPALEETDEWLARTGAT